MGVTFSASSAEPTTPIDEPTKPVQTTESLPVEEIGESSEPSPENDRDAAKAALVEKLSGESSEKLDDVDADLEKELEAEEPQGEVPETAPVEPETEPADELPDDPTEVEEQAFTPNANNRIRKLVTQRNDARKELETLQAAEKRYTDAGVDPAVRENWAEMGIEIQKLPAAEAGNRLARMALNLGWKPEVQEAKAPTLDLSEGDVADLIEDLIDDNEMTKSGWRQLKSALREKLGSTPAPAPASEPAATAPVDPGIRSQTTEFERQSIVNRVSTEMATTYGERWTKMIPDVQKEMDAWGENIPVAMMEKIARDAVSKIATVQLKAEQTTKANEKRTTATPKTGLRASDGQRTVVTSTGNAREDGKNDLLSRLASGDI